MLDEYGDEVEADLERFYDIDVMDFYRGSLAPRKLETLIRKLPLESQTATAVNGGPVWGQVEHLLADLWVALVRANSEKGSLPDDFDHPTRAEMTAKVKAEQKRKARELFLQRKRRYREGVQ